MIRFAEFKFYLLLQLQCQQNFSTFHISVSSNFWVCVCLVLSANHFLGGQINKPKKQNRFQSRVLFICYYFFVAHFALIERTRAHIYGIIWNTSWPQSVKVLLHPHKHTHSDIHTHSKSPQKQFADVHEKLLLAAN